MKRKYYILLLLCSLLPFTLHAQTGFGIVTPHTADFIRQGNMPVSLYTGQINLSVPLYHIQDPDFDVPLSLSYASEGFRLSKRSGWVGHDWSFIGAGVITREVYGVPDDFENYSQADGEYKGLWQATQTTQYFPADWYNFESNTLSCNSTDCKVPKVSNRNYDSEPDLFLFNMPGHSGRFMIDSQGNVQSNAKGYRIDLSGMSSQTDASSTLQTSQIKITAPNGYIYTFGSLNNINSLEYTFRFKSPTSEHNTEAEKKKTICAWHLTSITAPNGRQMVFEYAAPGMLDNTSPHIISSCTYNPSKTNGNGVSISMQGNDFYQATKIALLNAITITDTGVRIEFDNAVESLFGAGEGFFFGYEKYNKNSYQLNNMRVLQDGNLLYTYGLQYELKDYRRFLKQVTLRDGGIYSFDYFHPTSTSYPQPTYTNMNNNTDQFGFWNTDTNVYGIMKRVTYPTKGYTDFTYERHAYAKKVYTEVTNTDYTSTLVETNGNTYSFRIKQVKHYPSTGGDDSGNVITRNYSYQNGILLKGKPFVNIQANNNNKSIMLFLNNYVWNRNYNIEEPIVGYSYVRETMSDDSYIEYRFSDYETCPDEGDVNFHWENGIKPTPIDLAVSHATLAASKWYMRGLLLHKKFFDASDTEQRRIEYTYRNLGLTMQPTGFEDIIDSSYVVSRRAIPGGAMAMRFYLMDNPLYEERCTDYHSGYPSVQTKKSYCYNILNLPMWKKETASDGSEWKTTYSYTSEIGTLAAKNVLNKVVTEKTYRNGTQIATYKETPKLLSCGAVVTDSICVGKGNRTPEYVERYSNYDTFGNPTALYRRDSSRKVMIWGYKGTRLIAEIENAAYLEVKTVLGVTPESFSSKLTPNMATLDALRTALPQAQVTTYTYSPQVGVTSITNPYGEKRTYQYNSAGELISEKDYSGSVIATYDKHYKN